MNKINKVTVYVNKIRSYQNLVFKRGHRSFRKKEYVDYINEIRSQLTELKSVHGNYSLKLIFMSNTARVGDIDNLVKPISDILEMAGKVDNDRYCIHLEAERIIDKQARNSITIQTQERRTNGG